MKPQKAQVKDKGFEAECWDFRLEPVLISRFSVKELGVTPKTSFEADWKAFRMVFRYFNLARQTIAAEYTVLVGTHSCECHALFDLKNFAEK